MDWSRKIKLMTRWSLLTAVLIAGFWGMWYLIAGSVPTTPDFLPLRDGELKLPFVVSRWWDILLGPLYSSIVILVFTCKKVRDGAYGTDDSGLGFALGLFSGMVLICAMLAIPLLGIIGGIIFAFAEGVVVVMIFGLNRFSLTTTW